MIAWAIGSIVVVIIGIGLRVGWEEFVKWSSRQFVGGRRWGWTFWPLLALAMWLIWRYYISPQPIP